ncbi:hypothetical protein [Bradyrhizobium japonicum]|uniref:hypothetical protein n=1 Tax=Bradyrhizobium japonicum TaxID=375 RepID=UPI000456A12B|nr:hypothetical protein [Bradyrhizobium japonicum]AHY53333.1 hypothetical protein BJS_00711 [Bradyrhizobium japonicum SEMIA 5079]MCD9111099.1 hypothetical protein [Bradyrhizobium japonicum]MCD9256522.1 hypothetical protein [Bradyrhizobium japonicum SEMIA 5079]MCD9823976.1 hypothetical protein [Bradyrhizobium japonicum]MCD9896271.1 hypothetical protein [Bradyrhizobium japonicum]
MKMMRGPLYAVAVMGAIAITPACACDDGHWIQEVLADGQILKLEDGSMWKIDPTDTPTSSLWLAVSNVIVCDDEIVNVDDGEKVQVTRIR